MATSRFGTRGLAALIAMSCSTVVVVGPLELSMVSAAPPPIMHAVAVTRLYGFGPSAVNDSGQFIGSQYSGNRYHAYRATASAATELDAPAGSTGVSATSLADSGAVAAQVYFPTEYASAVFAPGSTVPTLIPSLGGNWSTPQGVNDAGMVVGSATTASGDSHAYFYDGTTTTDLGGPAGGSSNAQFVDATGTVVFGTISTSGGTTTVARWTNGVLDDLGNLGGTSASIGAVSANGHAVGTAETPAQVAVSVVGNALVDLGGLGGPSSSASAVNDAGTVVGGSRNAAGLDRAVAWSAPGAPLDLGTLGGDEAYASGIDGAGRIVGYSTLTPGSLFSSGITHGFIIDGGVMYDVNDLLPAGSVEVTTLYAFTDTGYLIGDSRSGQVLLAPGPADTPTYDIVELTPVPGARQVYGFALNDVGDALVQSDNVPYRWRAGSFAALPAGYATAMGPGGVVAGTIQSSQRGYRWDGTETLLPALGTSMRPADINGADDVVGTITTASGQQHAFSIRNGVATDLHAFAGSTSSEARTITETGIVSGIFQIGSGYRGFIIDGATTSVLQPFGGNTVFALDVNDAGTATGVSSTATEVEVAIRWTAGVMENLNPPGSIQSEGNSINSTGAIAGLYVSGSTPGVYRPFILDGTGYHYSPGLGGGFASLTDINDAGVAVGSSSLEFGSSHGMRFDGTNTVDLNRLVDPGSRFEITYASAINNSGWILAQAQTSVSGQASRAVLLVPHGGPDTLPPSITITSPANGAEYAVGANVVVDFSCADNIGIASCTANLVDGSVLDTSLPSQRALDVTAVDTSGNTTTRRSLYLILAPVDAVAPTVQITSPVDGGSYPLLTSALADFSCADNTAVAACGGSAANATPIGANVPGPTPFTVTAVDSSGNTASAVATYTVTNVLENGLGLTGSFTSPGVPYSVIDAPAPLGVTVFVAGGGTAPATMTACGGFTVSLTPGTQATLTCGSLMATVASGAATVTTPDGSVQMIVPAGGSGVLQANGSAQDLGGAPITVIGPLAALALTPATAVVGTNVAQLFTVRGLDAQGHDLGDLTSSAAFTISNGSCTVNSCRSGTVGVKTVTARVGTTTGTAVLDVRTRQTITFTAISAKTLLQTPVTAVATASSGLTVTFTSTTPTVCTEGGPNGATIALIAAGSCSIRADQSGDATFAPALPVIRTFAVSKANQTITFPTLAAASIDVSPVTVAASSSSGLPVTFTTTTPTVCTAGGTNGATITLLDAGTCTVRASQPGNAVYNAATDVNRNFTVTKLANTITFATIGGRTLAQSPVIVSATASSGLPVTFSTTTPTVCTAGGTDGATITLLIAGTCTVRANQAGDAIYRAATPVDRNVNVTKVAQTITFPAIPTTPLLQQTVVVSATASSGLPVTFTTTTPTVCTAGGTDGATITLLIAGTCTVRANQAGDAYWNAAPAVNRNVTVTPPPPAIATFGVTPTVVGSAGGTVQLAATVSNAATCRFAVSPALAGFPMTLPCTSGSAATSATLPANATASSRTYSFTVAALRTGATTATSTPVPVRVAPPGEAIADLNITGSANHDPAFAGVPLSITFTIGNRGPNTATTVSFTATVPPNTTLQRAVGSVGGACNEAAGTITCPIGPMASGASATVIVDMIPGAPGSSTITAQTVSAATDVTPADNVTTVSASVVESSIVYADDQTATLYRLSPFSSPTAITTLPGSKSDPVLSPDKRTVAYSRFDPGTSRWQVWLVGIDGTGERFVADIGTSSIVRPSWSPDGTTITFAVVTGGQWKAMLADTRGAPNVRLLIGDMGVGEMSPAFTADGSSIIFRDTCQRPAPSQCRYHRIAASGAGAAVGYDSYPTGGGVVVDASSTWFYFADTSGNIRRGRVDGTTHEIVAGSAYGGTYWSLSPSGQQIAYTEIVGNKPVVSVIGVDGQNHRQLTAAYQLPDPAGCYSPVWSRDESQVVMHCYAGSAIFIASASTSATSPVTPTSLGGSFRSRNAEWWGTRPSN